MTVGTSTREEVSNFTGRQMRIRSLSFSMVRCHSGPASEIDVDRKRLARIHSAVNRSQNITVPANQAVTSHGMTSSNRKESPGFADAIGVVDHSLRVEDSARKCAVWSGIEADEAFRTNVATGATIIASRAAHARKYRSRGPIITI